MRHYFCKYVNLYVFIKIISHVALVSLICQDRKTIAHIYKTKIQYWFYKFANQNYKKNKMSHIFLDHKIFGC